MDNFKKFFSGPKIIFIILGIIILVEVIYTVKVLNSPTPPATSVQKKAGIEITQGKISLITSKTTYKVNEAILVSVVVDTGGRSLDGIDLIARFDPKVLTATSGAIVRGQIFDEYPVLSVDPKNGLFSVSGINTLKNSFKGTGQFVLLNLTAKAPGKTTLTIDFQKGSTSDSNLVETGTSKDILEVVGNLELTVQ